MSRNPYVGLPDEAYWRRAVAAPALSDVDPVGAAPFRIGPRELVATAGSCFAQHIGRHLARAECGYLVTEPGHPMLGAPARRALHYGVYTARYGNIYTARQLLQLIERCYGRFLPQEDVWSESPGALLDPFRPTIQPGGFNGARAYDLDRAEHLRATREAFERLDVFVFTLGLTEAWRARADGAVFPLCPGVSGGVFSKLRHEFVNFTVAETVADMLAFIDALRAVNRRARVILTVSPVPLAATAELRHVLVSTAASKAVLRAACEEIVRARKGVAYFPSYEIVASLGAGVYFEQDKRTVTAEGVAHVMRLFSRAYLAEPSRGVVRRIVGEAFGAGPKAKPPRAPAYDRARADAGVASMLEAMCDEEALGLQQHLGAARDGTP